MTIENIDKNKLSRMGLISMAAIKRKQEQITTSLKHIIYFRKLYIPYYRSLITLAE